MRPMKPTTIGAHCLAVLRDGPATTSEIALELGMTLHSACAHMFSLQRHGWVRGAKFFERGKRWCWLWTACDIQQSVQRN